jgi:large subunit ribosomal protein L21
MYAIVESGGLQFMVKKDAKIKVPKLEGEVGSLVNLGKVLLLSDGTASLVGRPYVEEAQVKGKLLAHGKHDKVLIYKYKKRKNYRRKRGHRQDYSEILVTDIIAPELVARREAVKEAPVEAPTPPKKKPAVSAAKVKKPAKPAGAKVTKRAVRKKEKVSRPKAAAKGKRPTRRVIGRLRRKKEKE